MITSNPTQCLASKVVGLFVLFLATWCFGESMKIDVSSMDLPVGGSSFIEVYLDPEAGEVKGAGLTVLYDPAQLKITYVGANHDGLGGRSVAVHLVHAQPGRIVLAAARTGGAGHTPEAPELFARLKLTRLSGDYAFLVFDRAFTAPVGSSGSTAVPLSPVLFGLVPEDSDEDLMADRWELQYFPDLTVAGVGTDFDKDGDLDLAEYRAGTNPRIPYLSTVPEVSVVEKNPPQHILLSFPGESGVRYRLKQTFSLSAPSWGPVTFTVPGQSGTARDSIVGSGGLETLSVPLPPQGPVYFRIQVAEE